jgi:hypothetical protein
MTIMLLVAITEEDGKVIFIDDELINEHTKIFSIIGDFIAHVEFKLTVI